MSIHSSDTVARQWAMLRLLPRAPRKITAQDIRSMLDAHGFRTTSRTVERDLQALSQRFPLVVDESSKPYGWSWAKDANFEFAPRLSSSQSVALLLSRTHLHQFLPQALLHELMPLFDMAERELGPTGWKSWHRHTAVIPTALPLLPPKLSPTVLDHVHTALATRRCLSGQYRSKGSDSVREVTIHPLGLIVRGPVQYLVCTLFDYSDVRQLALHRLSDTKLLPAPSLVPENFDFPQYVAKAVKYEPQGTIRLVVLFDAAAAEHLRETPISHDQVLKDIEDTGKVELVATIESDETLRWWLRALGSKVEVLEPDSLRAEILSDIRSSLMSYQQLYPA